MVEVVVMMMVTVTVTVRRDGVVRGAIQGGSGSIVREGERWWTRSDISRQAAGRRLLRVVYGGDWMPLNRKPTLLLRGSYEADHPP